MFLRVNLGDPYHRISLLDPLESQFEWPLSQILFLGPSWVPDWLTPIADSLTWILLKANLSDPYRRFSPLDSLKHQFEWHLLQILFPGSSREQVWVTPITDSLSLSLSLSLLYSPESHFELPFHRSSLLDPFDHQFECPLSQILSPGSSPEPVWVTLIGDSLSWIFFRDTQHKHTTSTKRRKLVSKDENTKRRNN